MHCPYCHNEERIIKRGVRRNKRLTKQQYRCKNCEKTFIEHDGFEGKHYPKEIIVKAIHLYAEGLSLSKVRDYIYQHEGYLLYDSRILDWVNEYSHLLSAFESKLKPRLKGNIHTDEVVVKVKGRRHYNVASIDSKTKYDIAGTFTKKRSKTKCREHFGKLKAKIGEQVEEIWETERNKPPDKRNLVNFVSDGFENYRNGFNYHFHRIAQLRFGVPIASKKHGLEHNNNPIERHNEDFKQRYKVMRGFKSVESGGAFTEMRRFVYNFVRTHQGLGRTPAEEAELNIPLQRNKLLHLIYFLRG